MKYEDYYRIAESKISEYDSHGFRCKQWLVPLLTAFVLAAFYYPDIKQELRLLGLLSIILLFLVEMSFHSIHGRMTEYCKMLEREMLEHPNQEVSNISHTIGHFISRGLWKDWGDLILHTVRMVPRARGGLFYAAAILILWLGVSLSAVVGSC